MTWEQPIFVDRFALRGVASTAAGRGLAMTLICGIWSPERQPFRYERDTILAQLRARGDNLITAEEIERHEYEARRFFTVLDDGRWTPSPEFFSLNNGNDPKAVN